MFGRKPADPKAKENAKLAKEFKNMVKSKDYDMALKAGSAYLARVPNNHDVLFAMGGIHYMRSQFRAAMPYFDRALKIGEYDTEVLLLKARSHVKLAEPRKAVQCCKKILEVDPKNAEAKGMLATLGPLG